jgi:ribonuclease Z
LKKLTLTFLGTGAMVSKERGSAAIALKYGGDILLFDCGDGTLRQFINSKLSYMKIKQIFISHLHADHFSGIFTLIQEMDINGRNEILSIYCPGENKEDIETLVKIGNPNPSFKIKIRGLADKEKMDFGDYVIQVRKVDHSIPSIAYAFIEYPIRGKFDKEKIKKYNIKDPSNFKDLESGHPTVVDRKVVFPNDVMDGLKFGRKIVYSGDTKPCRTLKKLSLDTTALIHEATFFEENKKERIDSAFINIERAHSSGQEIAKIAKGLNPEILFLTHFSQRYKNPEEFKEEIQKIYKNTIFAKDFLEYEIRIERDSDKIIIEEITC